MIAEDTDKSQELNQPRIVSRELNLDFGQFFYPQEKRRIFDIRQFQSEVSDHQGNIQYISAIVNPHARLGTLTTFDERVFYALIEIWQEQNQADICRFSEREISRRINLGWGQNTAGAIRDSLTRLSGVSIEWKGSFYDSAKDELIEIHNPFSILNHLEITSTKNKHFKDKRAEFGFNKRVIKNLNSNYSRPVRFDVILSFRCPLAQALYTLIEPKLYGTKQYHRTTRGLVEDLGLIGKSYQRRAIRVQEFGKLQRELIGKPTSFGEVIEKYEINPGKDDALLLMTRSGAARIKGQRIEVLETPQVKRSEPSQKASQKPQKPRQEPKKSLDKDIPISTQEKPTEGKFEAKEVISYFHQEFGGTMQTSKSVVSKAEKIVKEQGLKFAKFLVDFARLEAPKTNYEPKSFSGIVQYRSDALKAWKANIRLQKRLEREAEQVAKRRREDARIDHEKAYRGDYYEYVNELVCSLGDEYPSRFNDFRGWQAEQRREKENLEGNLREVSLRVFDSEGQSILRLTQFFQDDPDIHIPDFWQWDSNHNPNPFSGSEAVV